MENFSTNRKFLKFLFPPSNDNRKTAFFALKVGTRMIWIIGLILSFKIIFMPEIFLKFL